MSSPPLAKGTGAPPPPRDLSSSSPPPPSREFGNAGPPPSEARFGSSGPLPPPPQSRRFDSGPPTPFPPTRAGFHGGSEPLRSTVEFDGSATPPPHLRVFRTNRRSFQRTPPIEMISGIQWSERSRKHGSKLSKLAELVRTKSSNVKRIGNHQVCFEDEYSIGKGSFRTEVYVGLSDDCYGVAIKRINLENCQQVGDNEKKILNCPKIRKEKHVENYRFYLHDEADSRTAYLVLDLYEESLRDYVLWKERPVEQLRKEGPSIIRQILSGIRALHCNNPEILHRDLKPSNILVNSEGEMVLADFGISRTLPEQQTTYKSGVSGTEGWMAAESLPTEDDDDDVSYADIQVRYKKQSDIQVAGMVFYYILTKGRHPYGSRIHRSSNVSKGIFDLGLLDDPRAKDLITWMLQHDPHKRPDVDECLEHPYLRTDEENFNLVTRVGNEREIKTKDATSVVVQELNKVPVLINWLVVVDDCVMNFMNQHVRTSYTSNAADLVRFVRNMAAHWNDKPPPVNVRSIVGKPQEYFQSKFPTLSVELHRIIRAHPDWTARDNLKDYF